ncbi:MAG: hypothetical protein ACRCTY_00905, partial [Candidatus Adiutrix sp.]
KRRGEAKNAPQGQLPPLNLRENSLLNLAATELSEKRPEKALELLREVINSNLERGRVSPESWRKIAQAEDMLGRLDMGRITAEMATLFLPKEENSEHLEAERQL